MNFSLATVYMDVPVAAIEVGGKYWPLNSLRSSGVEVTALDIKTLLQNWDANFPRLRQLAQRCASDADLALLCLADAKDRLELAIQYPNKLIAVGANYAGHLAEMGMLAERWHPMPIFFKPPTTAMVGTGKNVLLPRGCEKFDWEIELAVVVGRHLTAANCDEAFAGIAGYAVAIDLSARDQGVTPHLPFKVDLVRGKAQDTMCPFGPVIRPAAFVSDPQRLHLHLTVNGETRQDDSTSNMIYRIDEILSSISHCVTLEPGDVVLTGTPGGTAHVSGKFLVPGDRIVAEIENVGILEVAVVSDRSELGKAGRQFI